MAINVANNQSLTAITALPAAVSGGAMTLLETQTASSSATISFTSGIDSTYKEYVFKWINVHPATNNQTLSVNFRDGSTAYDATKTTTSFYAYHMEDDSAAAVAYSTGQDLAQGTGVQTLNTSVSNANDSAASGFLHLYDPSNTTFVKHFYTQGQNLQDGDSSEIFFIAGYCNTTSAIDGVQFKMASGDIDSGTFKLYGVV